MNLDYCKKDHAATRSCARQHIVHGSMNHLRKKNNTQGRALSSLGRLQGETCQPWWKLKMEELINWFIYLCRSTLHPVTVTIRIITCLARNPYKPSSCHYCWWLKSCTTKDDDYPIIYRVSYISGGAGFQPSTVSLGGWGVDPINIRRLFRLQLTTWLSLFWEGELTAWTHQSNAGIAKAIWLRPQCLMPQGLWKTSCDSQHGKAGQKKTILVVRNRKTNIVWI